MKTTTPSHAKTRVTAQIFLKTNFAVAIFFAGGMLTAHAARSVYLAPPGPSPYIQIDRIIEHQPESADRIMANLQKILDPSCNLLKSNPNKIKNINLIEACQLKRVVGENMLLNELVLVQGQIATEEQRWQQMVATWKLQRTLKSTANFLVVGTDPTTATALTAKTLPMLASATIDYSTWAKVDALASVVTCPNTHLVKLPVYTGCRMVVGQLAELSRLGVAGFDFSQLDNPPVEKQQYLELQKMARDLRAALSTMTLAHYDRLSESDNDESNGQGISFFRKVAKLVVEDEKQLTATDYKNVRALLDLDQIHVLTEKLSGNSLHPEVSATLVSKMAAEFDESVDAAFGSDEP
jgi:hypothetical protein